jgi:hypothetical protein
MASSQDRPTTVSATRARQGRLGRNIFWVLVFGIVLTVLGFAATWAWKASDFAAVQPSNAARKANAAHFQAPPPSGATRQNDQNGGPLAPQQNGGNPSNPQP